MLELFGWGEFTEAFRKSGGVHEIWNLLSLEPNLHAKFDHLNLWFESTDQVCHTETCQPFQLMMCTARPL